MFRLDCILPGVLLGSCNLTSSYSRAIVNNVRGEKIVEAFTLAVFEK